MPLPRPPKRANRRRTTESGETEWC